MLRTSASHLTYLDCCVSAFTCPTCSVGGADKDEVLAACDRTIRDEVCGQEEPMCEVSMHVFKSGRVRVNRWCTDQKTRQANKVACETYGNCPKTAYCTESGCKAVLEKKEKGMVLVLFNSKKCKHKMLIKLRLAWDNKRCNIVEYYMLSYIYGTKSHSTLIV